MSNHSLVSTAVDGVAYAQDCHSLAVAVDGQASGGKGATLVFVQLLPGRVIGLVKSCKVGTEGILPYVVYSMASDGTIVPYAELDDYEWRLRAEEREADYRAERDA